MLTPIRPIGPEPRRHPAIIATTSVATIALVISTSAVAGELGNLPEVREITRGQPNDVVALIERIAECNHWAGEEPYNQERAEQIRAAVQKAGCGDLDADTQATKQRYKGNDQVLDAIRRAAQLEM